MHPPAITVLVEDATASRTLFLRELEQLVEALCLADEEIAQISEELDAAGWLLDDVAVADGFDRRRGYEFSTCATWWIRHAVEREVPEKGRPIRVPVHIEREHVIARAQQDLTASLGRAPSDEEVAKLRYGSRPTASSASPASADGSDRAPRRYARSSASRSPGSPTSASCTRSRSRVSSAAL